MSQPLAFDENKFDKNVKLDNILNTNDDPDIGYFVEVYLSYPDRLKQKTNIFPIAPGNRKVNSDVFDDYMKKIKPDTYTQTKKLICDWTDNKNYSIHYRLMELCVIHGMVVDEVHDVISFKHCK